MKINDVVLRLSMQVRKIDGKYLAYFPAWKDVSAEGNTAEEARRKARAAAETRLNSLLDRSQEIPGWTDEETLPKEREAAFLRRKKLVLEQGFKPIKDISELTGFWPEGADFDEFYKMAVESRKHAEND